MTNEFAKRLLNLLSEPEFIQLDNIFQEPNFFKIVGRSHTERWHSAFWGWLVDPHGSHLTRDFVLKKFLMLLLDDACLPSTSNHDRFLLQLLPLLSLEQVDVSPNENSPSETSVADVGRFDIFCSANFTSDNNETGRVNILFELKIDAKPTSEQSKKYADWLYESYPNDYNLLIYLIPSLLNDSLATAGDERWYCMNYQLLNDKVLTPLLDHPNLNEKTKPFIKQYVKNLKHPHNGVKMAITDEEKRLAVGLYEKYSDVFDSIYDALVSAGTIDFSTSDLTKDRGSLAIKIAGNILSNSTVKGLFKAVLHLLVDDGSLKKVPLPWGSSKTRYIVTNESLPVHPSGKNFFAPYTYYGYTIETNYARDRAIKVLSDLCVKLELSFEQIAEVSA